MTISQRLFMIMKQKGISNADLSKGTGIKANTISDWQTKGTNPASDKIVRICDYLGITTGLLLSGEECDLINKQATSYVPNSARYDGMVYRRCGDSGIKLPAVSLGLWHNFGGNAVRERGYEHCAAMLTTAFDLGITHFDLANNYGPPYGSAEETFGRALREELSGYRDEIIISTKAGWDMWPGPYGDFGSKKYLVASLDQSLRRMGLDYVDIFYHHRPDPETPLEETMDALASIVRQGKALYAGVSNYNAHQAHDAYNILRKMGVRLLIAQPTYSIMNRDAETGGLLDSLHNLGVGSIAYSPLAQGLLTDRYLKGVPADSRAASPSVFLDESRVSGKNALIAAELNKIARERGQTLAQMAISWTLRGSLTSVIVGASRRSQIIDCAACINNLVFSDEELERIDSVSS